jgi:hypothetical protein
MFKMSLRYRQKINMVFFNKKQTHHFDKNVTLNFWNFDVNFSSTNIGKKKKNFILRDMHVLWSLDIKNSEGILPGKKLTGQKFFGMWMYLFNSQTKFSPRT